jgi:hypothetical protein
VIFLDIGSSQEENIRMDVTMLLYNYSGASKRVCIVTMSMIELAALV